MKDDSVATQVQVACLGETMAQLVPVNADIETAEKFALYHGGAESNVAVTLSRLGTNAAWVSRLGEDALGRRVIHAIAGEGVDVSAVTVDPTRPTGLFTKDVTGAERPVTYYRTNSAATVLSPEDVDRALATTPRVLHTSGITATLSDSSRVAVTESVARCRQGGVLLSFDVNYRPKLWADSGYAAEILGDIADGSDVLFVGLDEAAALWSCRSADEVRERFSGPRILVVKDGGREAVAYWAGSRSTVPALPVEIVEPVGAGDAFAAGFLHSFLQDQPLEDSLMLGHHSARVVLASRSDLGDATAITKLGIRASAKNSPMAARRM